ncbi:MAG: AraC family transcriptional regulator [Caryophanon sp.]|nr:AraC family transcriptional regulator [Caryophanon sp.]
MFSIHVQIHTASLSQKINKWLEELAPAHVTFVSSLHDAHVYIKEIVTLFDWIVIRRLQKAHPSCIIVPLLPEKLAYSAPIAIDLQLTYLLIEPVQKHKLLRAMRKIYEHVKREPQSAFTYYDLSIELNEQHSLYYDTLLRNLIRHEFETEAHFLQASKTISMEQFPNTVLFYQSFALPHASQKNSAIVYDTLREHMQVPLHFLPFGKHLAILLHVPQHYSTFQQWTTGRSAFEQAIEALKDIGIYSYVGIGQTFRDPMKLQLSYTQARLARRKPPANWIHMRYYDELPTHDAIQQAIQYIEANCHEPLNIACVAKQIGFSAPYFGKLFKKETGLTFPEYVAYTRIIQSLLPLRRTTQTLEQISAEYGFNTPNYFSGMFKKIVSISPSDYRQTTEMLFK